MAIYYKLGILVQYFLLTSHKLRAKGSLTVYGCSAGPPLLKFLEAPHNTIFELHKVK